MHFIAFESNFREIVCLPCGRVNNLYLIICHLVISFLEFNIDSPSISTLLFSSIKNANMDEISIS